MGQVAGNQNTCDRCSKQVFVPTTQTSSESSNWRELKRYTVDGALVTRFVCLDCYKAYQSKFASEDTSFNNFMSNVEE